MRSSVTFTALSVLVTLAMISAAPANLHTVFNELASQENALKGRGLETFEKRAPRAADFLVNNEISQINQAVRGAGSGQSGAGKPPKHRIHRGPGKQKPPGRFNKPKPYHSVTTMLKVAFGITKSDTTKSSGFPPNLVQFCRLFQKLGDVLQTMTKSGINFASIFDRIKFLPSDAAAEFNYVVRTLSIALHEQSMDHGVSGMDAERDQVAYLGENNIQWTSVMP
ncbi:hypothetical protein C8J56DRAFT_891904 [Mycena floridula]|nr:hypothetical protein C8J56DRAFT_891904 [Mycena floridula]